MLDDIAWEMRNLAGMVDEQKSRVGPMTNEILAVIGGSARRADMEMSECLRAVMSAIDVAVSALHTAASFTDRAAEAERVAEQRRAAEAAQDQGLGY
jgi:hypothetical protein